MYLLHSKQKMYDLNRINEEIVTNVWYSVNTEPILHISHAQNTYLSSIPNKYTRIYTYNVITGKQRQ